MTRTDQRWRTVAREVAVLGAAAAVTIGGTHGASQEQVPPARALDAPAFVLLALLVSTVLLRHRAPLAELAAASVLLGGYSAAGYPHGPPFTPMVIAALSVGIRHDRWTAWRATSAAGLVIAAGWTVGLARGQEHVGWGTLFQAAALVLICGVPALVGVLVRSNRAAAAQAKEETTRRRVEQERLRLAREVHDVVGHSLSVISLRAAVALHVLDRRPEQAQPALEAIRRASVDALTELRATLALTQPGADPPPHPAAPTTPHPAVPRLTPASSTPAAAPSLSALPLTPPGIAARPTPPLTGLRRLASLLREVRLCGVPAELVTGGRTEQLTALPANIDLAAFRIVQESLTNVLRHARRGDSRVRVTLTIGDGQLTIDVTDQPDPIATLGSALAESADPPPAIPTDAVLSIGSPPAGSGLAGLLERAAELGGTLTAGPADGGWRVHATLPLPAGLPAADGGTVDGGTVGGRTGPVEAHR